MLPRRGQRLIFLLLDRMFIWRMTRLKDRFVLFNHWMSAWYFHCLIKCSVDVYSTIQRVISTLQTLDPRPILRRRTFATHRVIFTLPMVIRKWCHIDIWYQKYKRKNLDGKIGLDLGVLKLWCSKVGSLLQGVGKLRIFYFSICFMIS